MGPAVAIPISISVCVAASGGAAAALCSGSALVIGGSAVASGLAALGLYWYHHGGDSPRIQNLNDEFTKAYNTLTQDEKDLFEDVMKNIQRMANNSDIIRTFMKSCAEQSVNLASVVIDEEGKENPERTAQVSDIESQRVSSSKTKCSIKDKILEANRRIMGLRSSLNDKENQIKDLTKKIKDLKKKASIKIKAYKKKNEKLKDIIVDLNNRVRQVLPFTPKTDSIKTEEELKLENVTLHQFESESESGIYNEDEPTVSCVGLDLTSVASFSTPSEIESENAELIELKENLKTLEEGKRLEAT